MKFSHTLLEKLFPKTPPLKRVVELLNFHSFEVERASGDMLDIKFPANRYSDAASHIGIAREIAAVLGHDFKTPVKRIVNLPTKKGFLAVKVEDKVACPRYAARYFEIDKVGQSPAWIKKILKTCGVQPINSVVDLMNYVMLETGQPLHAFDADQLYGDKVKTILVRYAKKDEHITTLDGRNIKLDTGVLIIAGLKNPLAIAGIKGGKDFGITEKTKRIVVEAANFNAQLIRKSAHDLKLPTDAALRFAHDISPALVDVGLDRATALLSALGARLRDSADVYPRPASEEVIEFSADRYAALIGAPISLAKAKGCFIHLGFSIDPVRRSGVKNSFLVRVPSWRTDVTAFEDLAEEVMRLEGVNKLTPRAPEVNIRPVEEDDAVIIKDLTRDSLVRAGLSEVYNYSFVSVGEDVSLADKRVRQFLSGKPVALENPTSVELAELRTTLTFGLLKNIRDNSRFFERISIFEIGKVFATNGNKVRESLYLGIALAARGSERISELKGMVSEVLEEAGIGDVIMREEDEALLIESDHDVLGLIQSVRLEKGVFVATAELDLGNIVLLAEEEKEYRPLAKFPAVIRDISILVNDEVRIGDVVQEIQDFGNLIENVDLSDEYSDPKLGDRRSLTFRIIFQAHDRTLSDKEVNVAMAGISEMLIENFDAEIR
jgi:phenylalanyl-tRNA synthetase beta chain